MKNHDPAWLDRMYNNRALVPAHPQHFERWAQRSQQVRAEEPCVPDLRYGDGADETLDVYPAPQPGAPVLVFIHGGYWRALDKREHAFIAPAFTRVGACVVIPNYTLCPRTTVPGIVMEMVRALAWTYRHIKAHGGDPGRITVAGHSAGGQLAAMMLCCRWTEAGTDLPPDLVRSAVSVSGLHDLEPLMHAPFLQPSLGLTPRQVAQASPARLPAPAQGTMACVAGGDESAEFHRQARLLQQAWAQARVPVCELLPGLDHFTVLDALAQPASRLHRLVTELLRA